MTDDYVDISLLDLRVGMAPRHPILQADNSILITDGVQISPKVIHLLQRRGVSRIRVHRADLESADDASKRFAAAGAPPVRFIGPNAAPKQVIRQRHPSLHKTAASRRLDEEIEAGVNLNRRPGSGYVNVRSRPITSMPQWRQMAAAKATREEETIELCHRIQHSGYQRSKVEVEPLLKLVEDWTLELGEDPDLFVFVQRPPGESPYPSLHSMLAARFSMALAAYLKWSREEMIGVAVGAFCHDLGMYRVASKSYRTRAPLTSIEKNDIQKHPIYALDFLGNDAEAIDYVRHIVYQVHERCNGDGYPRCRPLAQIHPAARLVGLADAFVAMISDRPHRPALLPHHAILEIMQETKHGLWEPSITKALLRAVSIFPLGSFVELSDGRVARSIQTSGNDHMRPLLEAWTDPAATAFEPGKLLNLVAEPNVSILRPVAPPQIM